MLETPNLEQSGKSPHHALGDVLTPFRGDTRLKVQGLGHWSLLTVFDDKIIPVMASYPKPHHICASLNRNCSIVDAHARGPKSPSLLEVQ